jgi:hypothetical protein
LHALGIEVASFFVFLKKDKTESPLKRPKDIINLDNCNIKIHNRIVVKYLKEAKFIESLNNKSLNK